MQVQPQEEAVGELHLALSLCAALVSLTAALHAAVCAGMQLNAVPSFSPGMCMQSNKICCSRKCSIAGELYMLQVQAARAPRRTPFFSARERSVALESSFASMLQERGVQTVEVPPGSKLLSALLGAISSELN